jgi:methylmalonyl-CoA/ethylmalonyl-CoA epimerase
MKLAQVALNVKDLPAAVAFHRDILGLPPQFEVPPNLAFFDMGGVRLMLSTDASGESPEFVLYYKVDDIQAAWTDMLAKGAVPGKEAHRIAKMPDHELWLAFVRDPENRMVAIMSEVRN